MKNSIKKIFSLLINAKYEVTNYKDLDLIILDNFLNKNFYNKVSEEIYLKDFKKSNTSGLNLNIYKKGKGLAWHLDGRRDIDLVGTYILYFTDHFNFTNLGVLEFRDNKKDFKINITIIK